MLDQVRADQRIHQPPRLPWGGVHEDGHAGRFELTAWMQSQQPQRACLSRVQAPVRPGEDGPHGSVGIISGSQQVEPGLYIREVGHQVGQRHVRAGNGQLGRDAQRQRQPCAVLYQGPGGLRLFVDPRADQHPQQGHGLRLRQQIQVHAARAVAGDQARQGIAARNDNQARGRPGQQRADLLSGARVVQDDQHSAAGGQAPEPGRSRIEVVRNVG